MARPGELGAALRRAVSGTPLAAGLELFAGGWLESERAAPAADAFEPQVLTGLARVLASRPEAARYLKDRPDLWTRIAALRPDGLAARTPGLVAIRDDPPLDAPDLLECLRHFRRDETLLAACLDLGGLCPHAEVSTFLSILAETCISWALAAAREQAGGDPTSGLTVVGMGGIGGRELTYQSDLDLVFLYPESSIDPAEPARIAQWLIGALSTPTRAGVAYPVDARLRPSGRQGTLISTFESFERYQLERAALWEHLALMRTRPLAGHTAECERRLSALRARVLARPRPRWIEIDRIRKRIERERAAHRRGAFKTGPGGLMDVEFLAAGGLLELGPVEGLPATAHLLTAHVQGPVIERLLADHAQLARLEARARWVTARSIESFDFRRWDGPIVAELLEPGRSPHAVANAIAEAHQRIRRAFRSVVEADTLRVLGRPGRVDSVSDHCTVDDTCIQSG